MQHNPASTAGSPHRFYIGVDLVHVPSFSEQLQQVGSRFASGVFSALENRVANTKPDTQRAAHLAGRWAAKEAFIKAWSQSRYGRAPIIAPEELNWSEIEIRPDAYGRIQLGFRGRVEQALHESFGANLPQPQLSVSHDGDYAIAHCLLQLPD